VKRDDYLLLVLGGLVALGAVIYFANRAKASPKPADRGYWADVL
jgi:hypothetical protein